MAAGTVLSNLEVRVLNQEEKEVAVDPSQLQGKGMGLKASWKSRGNKEEFPRYGLALTL